MLYTTIIFKDVIGTKYYYKFTEGHKAVLGLLFLPILLGSRGKTKNEF